MINRLTLEHAQVKPFSAEDLMDMAGIGDQLCQWYILAPMPNVVVEWTALVYKAAEDRKTKRNVEAYEYWWPTMVFLLLKMEDLNFADIAVPGQRSFLKCDAPLDQHLPEQNSSTGP